MDFGFSPEEERFAHEVRELFLQNKELVKKARQEYRSGGCFGPGVFGLMRKLGERGWLCPHWPKEYGGLGLSAMHHHIVMNEMDYFAGYGQQVGTVMAGPVIMRYGTERQKKKYLPPIARGEVEFALGYTEPQAGSDTSAIDLGAVEEDDHFILNGQKMFNTHPLIFPIMTNAGFHPIATLVIMGFLGEAATMTPPIGLSAFVVAGVARTKPEEVFRGVLPFFLIVLALLWVIVFFPQLVTWLPNLFYGALAS
jgi:alkylation response protein AidB-like acyl-CoA dehydrogenase